MLSRRMSLPKMLTSSTPPDHGGDDQQKECAIKVVIRARPLSDREFLAKTPVVVNVTRTSVQVINPIVFLDPTYLEAVSSPTKRATQSNLPIALTAQGISAAVTAGECRAFHFDRCFGVDNAAANDTEPFANSYDIDFSTQRPNQELIFDEIGREMIESAFQGFNCTVLAYGQTGSGKTHTMVGEKTTKGKGLIPRVCEALFAAIEARRSKEGDEEASGEEEEKDMKKTIYSTEVSYCEIYKEKVNDLLDAPSLGASAASGKSRPPGAPPLSPSSGDDSGSSRKTLKVREHPTTGPFVEGLSSRPVASYADIAEEMLAGEKLRTVAATLMNAVSSRSHAVFTITFTQTTFDPVTQTAHDKTSKMSMIDLAGSERANASGTSGDRLKEGAMINKSLTTLGRVISALSKKSRRKRKGEPVAPTLISFIGALTEGVAYAHMDADYYDRNDKPVVGSLCLCSFRIPFAQSYDETMSTLRYAESAKRVINRAVVNEDKNARIIRQLRQEIQDLRMELDRAKRSPRRRSNSAADVSTKIPERDEFQAQLLQEVAELQAQAAQQRETSPPAPLEIAAVPAGSPQRTRGSIHLSTMLPSLVNVRKHLRPENALAYSLIEGRTVFGSGSHHTEHDAADQNEECSRDPKLALDEVKMEEDKTPSPRKQNRSWSPTFLRRRSSSSISAANNTAGSLSPKHSFHSPGKCSKTVSDHLETQFYRLASDRTETPTRHAQIVCTSVVPADESCVGKQYRIEIESIDADAVVRVNGKRLGTDDDTRVELHHGDRLQFEGSHDFRLYVPQMASASPQSEFEIDPETTQRSISHDRPSSEPKAKVVESLDVLVADANEICSKWNLNTEFALKKDLPSSSSATDALDLEEDGSAMCVVVKKHLGGQRYSLVEWKRPMLEAKVSFLRQFAESLESAGTITSAVAAEEDGGEERDHELVRASSMDKMSLTREADATAEDVSKAPSYSTSSSLDVASSSTASNNHIPSATFSSPHCIRLIGQGRIYFPSLTSYSNGPMIAAVYDGAGLSIGKLYMHLQFTSPSDKDERRPSFFSLTRRPSLRSMTQPTKPKVVQTIMRIHLDKIVFDVSQSMASEGISLTLRKWRDGKNATRSGDKKKGNGGATDSGTANFSTPKIAPHANHQHTAAPYDPLTIFHIEKVFDAKLPSMDGEFVKKRSSADKTASGDPNLSTDGRSTSSDDFIAFEVWGYGQVLPPVRRPSLRHSMESSLPSMPSAPAARKIDFYASADIDEREQDGIFRPVAVKNDGTLRLHVNQPRRLSVRITQADQQPFALVSIASVMISPPFAVDCNAASLSVAGGKSTQWLLSPTSKSFGQHQELADRSELQESPVPYHKWHPLEFRSGSESDPSSRSLSVSVKWDKETQVAERVDVEGSRSVYRVVIALTTSWSHVPIVISKSIVTKISPAVIPTKLKLARELETTRMAWWARESFSREYRLGTWYTADVSVSSDESMVLGAEESDAKDQIVDELKAMMVQAVVTGHIKGLLRLEMVFELEHIRQQILKMAPLSTTETMDKDGKTREIETELSFERVSECLNTLFESGDDQEQAFEAVQLQSNPQLFLRRKTRKDLLAGIKYGNVVDLSPANDAMTSSIAGAFDLSDGEIAPQFVPWRELHFAHFVTEPSHLASESPGGEMAGFLMLSSAFQMDEAAITPLSASVQTPRGPTTKVKPVRANWERRWFVLKRPFLYAYKSFALKEEVGVLDISRCQLLTSLSTNGGALSNSSSSSSSLTHAPISGSADGGHTREVLSIVPFSFQLVSLMGSKCVVWTLQASTSSEMRAWLVAIDPLKIEAREAVVNTQSSLDTPAVTA